MPQRDTSDAPASDQGSPACCGAEPQEVAMSRRHTAAADQPITHMELFAGLSRRQLRQVVALSTLVRRPAGAVLAREGQFAQELLVLISGGAVATVDGVPVANLTGGAQIGSSVVG